MEAEEPWEALDLDDSDLPSLLRACKRRRSPSPTTTPTPTPTPAAAILPLPQSPAFQPPENHPQHQPPPSRPRSIPGPAGAVQAAILRKNLDCETQNFSCRREVVAVVKSCTPNGLGGLMVLLKDPTGTVGASIHHKVLSESEFGKNISIGSVLILQKVAVFAPVRSAHYLNITLKNMVKVFSQDSCSTSKLQGCAYPVQYADPGIEYCGEDKTMEVTTVQNVSVEDIEKRQRNREAENLQNFSVIQRQNLFGASVRSKSRATMGESAAWREPKSLNQDACKEVPEQMTGTRSTADHLEFVNGSEKSKTNGNSEGSLLSDTHDMTNSVGKSSCEEIQGTDLVGMQRQPQISKTSLPEWTDEQLDELFAGDGDDGSVF
ncbi:UNVERIFIED_CONTAM: hypothetical protein Scaly_0177300 [Sesamum calycinum]|uniref:Homologous recombination OB-fold protein OB-fold domain-containing protein n=1 Tax=Sesamum calycinum TaxID=2727403 RepID=A0AAW2SYD3_9LAMI